MKLTLLALALVSGVGFAAPIIPTSYTAPPGQSGWFSYPDDSGTQLTDGIIGANDWPADLGNGHAYEWVGWLSVNPALTFNFAGPVNISQVNIGFNRETYSGMIFLPSSVTINGNNFSLSGNEIAEHTRGFVSFNVILNGVTSVAIDLADSDPGRWIFVDEVRFDGAADGDAAVPEPGTFALAGVGVLAIWFGRLGRGKS